MDKLWLYDGVAYASRDLAILHGADELSLYSVEYNDTQDDEIELELYRDRLVVEDNYDTTEIPTEHLNDLDYFGIDFNVRNLSKDMRGRIEDKIYCLVDELKYEDEHEMDDEA